MSPSTSTYFPPEIWYKIAECLNTDLPLIWTPEISEQNGLDSKDYGERRWGTVHHTLKFPQSRDYLARQETALSLSLASKTMADLVAPVLYHTLILTSLEALESINSLIERRPHIRRHIKRLCLLQPKHDSYITTELTKFLQQIAVQDFSCDKRMLYNLMFHEQPAQLFVQLTTLRLHHREGYAGELLDCMSSMPKLQTLCAGNISSHDFMGLRTRRRRQPSEVTISPLRHLIFGPMPVADATLVLLLRVSSDIETLAVRLGYSPLRPGPMGIETESLDTAMLKHAKTMRQLIIMGLDHPAVATSPADESGGRLLSSLSMMTNLEYLAVGLGLLGGFPGNSQKSLDCLTNVLSLPRLHTLNLLCTWSPKEEQEPQERATAIDRNIDCVLGHIRELHRSGTMQAQPLRHLTLFLPVRSEDSDTYKHWTAKLEEIRDCFGSDLKLEVDYYDPEHYNPGESYESAIRCLESGEWST